MAYIVKKYQGSEEEMEDLISIGTIGLIKAITTFNSEKGPRLATYAAQMCIRDRYQAELFVLGLPKNMNSTLGERAEKSLEFGRMLERRTGLPVVMWRCV